MNPWRDGLIVSVLANGLLLLGYGVHELAAWLWPYWVWLGVY